MRKWYRKLKLDNLKKMILTQEEKIIIKNNLKKYSKYVNLLMLRRTTVSYPKKYAHLRNIPNSSAQ